MIEANWVRPAERSVHLRVLLSIVFNQELGRAGVRPETTGVTLGDVAILAKLVWPDLNWWWSEFLQHVPNQLRPVLLEQYRAGFTKVQHGVSDGNFETWLAEQAQHFGGEWLTIASAPLPAAEPAVRPEVRGV